MSDVIRDENEPSLDTKPVHDAEIHVDSKDTIGQSKGITSTEASAPDEDWSKASTLGSATVQTTNADAGNEDNRSMSPAGISPEGSDRTSSSSPATGDDDSSDSSLSNLTSNDRRAEREGHETQLPDTVTVLNGPCDGKVYVVGTAHFSHESNQDVEETIRKTRPNVVVVELCESRVAILALDEATILEDSKNLNFDQVSQNIKKMGLIQGLMYTLLLSLSAQLTRELGMAPGGEFRRAFTEAKKIPGCIIQLGDRPVGITLRRAISSLTPWQKIRMAFSILFCKETVTKEEVEKCKQRDLLESMLREITGEYPQLSKVLVDERDIYLAYSLQLASTPLVDVRDPSKFQPVTVVGVVGIGHVPGIVKNWGTVRDEDIPKLLEIPAPSLTSVVIVKTIQYSAISAVAYGFYRFLLPKSVKSLCHDSVNLLISSASRIIHR